MQKHHTELIIEKFHELFESQPIVVRSPGRLNLIGEHTDYNNGYVMPAAIDKEMDFAVASNQLGLLRFYAFDLYEYFEIHLSDINKSELGWPNYLLGIIEILTKRNHKISGVDCVFGGDIPLGAGLSSSAALENGFVYALNSIFSLNIPKAEMIKISQKAEHEWAGVMCGIMDQFASMFGEKDQAIMIDCQTLEHEYINLNLKGYKIVLVDSKVKHNLASSEYNTRRQECERGVGILKKYEPEIKSLRDVNALLLNKYKDELDEVVFNRCSFVVEENERVLMANKALKSGDIISFGELVYGSHEGLKTKYEVSCTELDELVKLSKDSGFVIGARMMGGGFGGCTINIVEESSVDAFCSLVKDEYKSKTGIDCAIYHVNICDGTSIIPN